MQKSMVILRDFHYDSAFFLGSASHFMTPVRSRHISRAPSP